MKKLITILGIMLLTGMMSTQGHAVNINTAQDAPTYSADGYPDTNFNNYNGGTLDSELWTGSWYGNSTYQTRSYLDFDLSGITNISEASLWLYQGYSEGSTDVYATAVTSAWDETTITWNNQPAIGALADTTTVGNTSGWYFWDLTSLAQANETSTLSVALHSASANAGKVYYASETSSGNAPYLQVSVVPEPISSTLFLVGAATMGFRRFRKMKKA
ncbi:MAG TPA: DNRLRE domain-containing protein [Nitrospirae bacterium]|nr:DNRLRE domain-containing protein [Nitrospirota bacterium]